MLMSLNLPNRELRLGQDVVAPTGIANFPQDLISLEDQRVKELVLGFDSGLNTLSGSAADNWASLDDPDGLHRRPVPQLSAVQQALRRAVPGRANRGNRSRPPPGRPPVTDARS